MKEFFVNGERANWANLNVTALNVKSGILCNETAIPEHLRLKVTIADKFDTNAPNLDEVSESTSEYAMRHGKHRHFLLLNGNRVVGWAAFHRKERDYKVTLGVATYSHEEYVVKAKTEEEAYLKAVELADNAERNGDVVGLDTECIEIVR